MRPLELKLRNFIGIRSGLNRDEIALDLRGLRGLVAIVGDNGMGKTTVLDSLTPYRLMAYRAGGYSPRQFSYYEETYGDALKELVWEHGGSVYRSEIIIKGSNKTKKTEAYLYVQMPEGWAPAAAPDGTVSDGKTDTYDTCVNAILGTPEMFFTAVFSAQNRRQLSDYSAGDIKLLLSELLGLDHLLDLADSAAKAGTYQQARYDALSGNLAALATAESELATVVKDVHRNGERLHGAKGGREGARRLAADKSMALAEARARAANADENARRRQTLTNERAAADREMQATLVRLRDDYARARDLEACAPMLREMTAIETQIRALSQQADGFRSAINAAPLEDASGDIAAAETDLSAADAAIAAINDRIKGLADAPAQAATLRERMAALAREGTGLVSQSKASKERAALAARVPCAGLDINSTCPLLANAHTAKGEAVRLDAEAESKRQQYSGLKAQLDVAEAQATDHKAAAADLTAAQARRTEIETRLTALRRKQAAAAAADQARTALAAAEANLAAAQAQAQEKRAAIEQQRAQATQRMAEIKVEAARVEAAGTARVASLQVAIDAIPTGDAETSGLAAAERELAAAEEALSRLDAEIVDATQKLADAEAGRKALEARLRDAGSVREESARLGGDIAQWRLLAKGLGRDGIVALSIDDAGPTISGIANDLLTACYGPRFSLRFDTQAETKDGRVRETFDIRVFDADRGDDKSIAKTSGGERVWLDEALVRAIALFQAQSSGRRYQCLFSDEADGALSPERKRHYMRMKRKVLELGGYEVEFFISHTPELWQEADAVIDMSTFKVPA